MAILIVSKFILAFISLIFGILVLVFPGFLRFIIGAYFILMGVLTLLSI